MRTASTWIVALAAAIPALQAQTAQSASPAEPVRAYSLLREDENWSFLEGPIASAGPSGIRFKYISLGHDDWFLTIGGEAREVFEQCRQR